MTGDKQRVASIEELRAALVAHGDDDALRRFDAAVAANLRLQAIRVAREIGIIQGRSD